MVAVVKESVICFKGRQWFVLNLPNMPTSGREGGEGLHAC